MSKKQKLTMPVGRRMFILYDSRACGGDTEDASILVVCESNEEACSHKGGFGGMACFSYLVEEGNRMVDERFEWNYYD